MNTNQTINIAIIDDSAFDLRLMTQQIRAYTAELTAKTGCEFGLYPIQSMSELRNFPFSMEDMDIAIIDFYLDQGETGATVLDLISDVCGKCKTIMISQTQSMQTMFQAKRHGPVEFVHKADQFAIKKICYFIETVMESKYSMTSE